EAPGTTFKLSDLISRPVPQFKIRAPTPGATDRTGHAIVSIDIAATPDPVKVIRVQVNGRQIKELTPDDGMGRFPPGEQLLDVPLARGRNEVRITLVNAIGETTETLSLLEEGEGELDKRGTLYIIAIGVDKYPGLGKSCGASGQESCDLSFAGADARAFARAAEERLSPSHAKLVQRVLVNDAPEHDA